MTRPTRLDARAGRTRNLGRRGLLGASAGLGLALLSGCSALPSLPGIGGGRGESGSSILDLFSEIDPAIWGEETRSISWDENPLFHPLSLHFSRPRAIGELFGMADDLEPTAYNDALPREELPRTSQPILFTAPNMAGLQGIESALTSNRFRYAPEAAVLATHSSRQAALWRGVDEGMFAEIEELLLIPDRDGQPSYTREGERLLPALERTPETVPPFVIAQSGSDLQIFQEVETPEFDAGGSAVDLFVDLQELMDAVDLPDAHAAQAFSYTWSDEGAPTARDEGETATFVEWLYATELTSTTEHTSRGALRVRNGDPEIARRALLSGAAKHRGTDLVVVEAEQVSEEILLVMMDSDAQNPDPVGPFYDRGSSFSGPGVRLGS